MLGRHLTAFVMAIALLGGLVGSCTSPTGQDSTKGRKPTWAASPTVVVANRADPPSSARLRNQLSDLAGAFLHIATDQPVAWQPYGDEAFLIAAELDRPILLAIGTRSCHWCNVMDGESYGDPALAGLINNAYVPVRVDALARPDLDRRYQQAAQLLSGEGGWPLTLVLTPGGDAIAGGSYFSPAANGGRPSLRVLLEQTAAVYRESGESVTAKARQLTGTIERLRNSGIVAGSADGELRDSLAQTLLSSFDRRYGGFGSSAKAPPTQAIAFALQRYAASGDANFLVIASQTLDAMASGAIRDQLSGAFYRLTLDPNWQSPHFEIDGALNGLVTQDYLRAYQANYADRFRIVGERTIDYLTGVLVDRERGGFYAGQDADVAVGDDGGYYTWTANQMKTALPADGAAAAIAYFGVPAQADATKLQAMPPPSALYVARPIGAVAELLGQPYDQVRARLEASREHLSAARAARRSPPIDQTYYADRNAALASAFFEAAAVLRRTELRDIALRAVDLLLAQPRDDGLIAHSYNGNRPSAPPLLDDQAATAAAALDAFAATGDVRYREAAGTLLDRAIAVFSAADGGFYDVAAPPGPGVANSRLRVFDDGPILAGNPLAAITLDRYAQMSGNSKYRELAKSTLGAFAGAAREYGVFASGYALALDSHLK